MLTEIADWWESQRKESEKTLNEFVAEHPSHFAYSIATTVYVTMVIGSGVVDILKIGDGIAEGGWKGWGQDGLRILAVAGPMGKGAQLLKSAANTKVAMLIIDIGGPRCSWIASTKALAQTGHTVDSRLFTSIDDLARAVGIAVHHTAGISLHSMTSNLRAIGARIGNISEITSISGALRILPRDGSVVLISVKCMRQGVEVGGHALYVFYNTFGQLRFMDRTGVYNNLADVTARYSNQLDELIPRAAVRIDNIYAKLVGPEGTTVLAIEVLAVTTTEPDSLKKEYEDFKNQ